MAANGTPHFRFTKKRQRIAVCSLFLCVVKIVTNSGQTMADNFTWPNIATDATEHVVSDTCSAASAPCLLKLRV